MFATQFTFGQQVERIDSLKIIPENPSFNDKIKIAYSVAISYVIVIWKVIPINYKENEVIVACKEKSIFIFECPVRN